MEEIVTRPWGTYQVLLDESNYKVKRIVVNPSSRLSLQSHNRRAEHWIIVSGTGTVFCGDRETEVAAGEHCYIAKQSKHRMSNYGSEPVVFIEVQTGDYFGEDDIIRYEDDYGRS